MKNETTINGKVIDGLKVPKAIRRQPGYVVGGAYEVARTASGGKRLYKWVSGRWMDASLENDDELVVTAEPGELSI